MSTLDDRAADALADAEAIRCPGCVGYGYTRDDDRYYRCDQCDGSGYWKPPTMLARFPKRVTSVRLGLHDCDGPHCAEYADVAVTWPDGSVGHVCRAHRGWAQAAQQDDETFVCPTCRGTRTIQPDRCTPPEPCPRCVDPDEGG